MPRSHQATRNVLKQSILFEDTACVRGIRRNFETKTRQDQRGKIAGKSCTARFELQVHQLL